MTERDVFIAALQEEDPAHLKAYLDKVCAGQPELRQQVEDLLRLHECAGSFLDNPALDPAPTGAFPDTAEQPPSREPSITSIGPYKLLEQIGEGGMGTVWMAQQQEPVRRLVALKLIKAGMGSQQVVARFEAERQALALMDHPNIARVLDAGSTETGSPYFVMDLVRGLPITRYCDRHRLTPRQRLELFIPVCQAVQHAHQKGVIHRDIKPSNVLVALYDGKPVPRVIDFGVAKATGQTLTDRTLVTGFGTIVGTLEYMSPEQAEMNQLDIDTRSDIYSLGVLLYELLTGSPPFTRKELEGAGILEMLRVIREQEPTRPSARLSSAKELPTLATNRGTEPAKLTRLVRGELDWIVIKALEKDRTRRYETASAFAADVLRYLTDEPVQACPPSTWYRFGKLVRRNRGAFAGGMSAALAVLLTMAGLAVGMVWIKQERDEKDAALQAKSEALQDTEKALRQVQRHKDLEQMSMEVVWEASRRYFKLVAADPRLKAPEFLSLRKELLGQAVLFFELLARRPSEDPRVESRRGQAYEDLAFLRQEIGETEEALKDFEQSREVYGRLAAKYPDESEYRLDLARSYHGTANMLATLGRRSEAEPLYREAVTLRKKVLQQGNAPPGVRHNLAITYLCLGLLCRELGRQPEALEYDKEALTLQRQLVKDFPQSAEYRQGLAMILTNLSQLFQDMNKPGEAEEACLEAIAIQEKLVKEFPRLPEYQHELAFGYNHLGGAKGKRDLWDEARAAYDKALPLQEKLVADFPRVPEYHLCLARTHNNRGKIDHNEGKPAEAARSYRTALAIYEDLVQRFPRSLDYAVEFADCCNSMGRLLLIASKPNDALPWFTKAIDALKPVLEQEPKLVLARENLCMAHWGRARVLNILGRHEAALADYDRALEFDDEKNHPILRIERARTLVDVKQYARATAEADAVAGATDAGDEILFPAAMVYAVSAHFADAEDRRRYADRALELLRQAVARGFKDLPALEEDARFDGLRSRADFRELLTKLDEAFRLEPGAAAAYVTLGNALNTRGRTDDAVAAYRKAIRLEPDLVAAHYNLALTLKGRGDRDGAIAALVATVRLQPDNKDAHSLLAEEYQAARSFEKAVGAYKRAIELDPNRATLRFNFGNCLSQKGDNAGAIEAYREAINLDPKYAPAWNNLGARLFEQGKYQDAAEAFRESIAIEPDRANAHNNLGSALEMVGQLPDAIKAYREAVRLDRKYANAHGNLGYALARRGDLEEAVTELEEAIRLAPTNATFHDRLGIVLRARGDLDRAATVTQKAIDLEPLYAEAHCNLGHILQAQGQFTKSLAAYRKGHELGSKIPGWPRPSAQWVRQAERWVEVEEQLPAVLEGKVKFTKASNQLDFAWVAKCKKQFAASARFYQDAFAAQPRVEENLQAGFRESAAGVAARAAAGAGVDAGKLTDQERAELRKQALKWLRANLKAWAEVLEEDPLKNRPVVERVVTNWTRAPEFASLRDEKRLGDLPQDERETCRKFWADVEALRARARTQQPPGGEEP